jgi:hypothetical protein
MESSFIKTPELKLKVNFENRPAVYHSTASPKPMLLKHEQSGMAREGIARTQLPE